MNTIYKHMTSSVMSISLVMNVMSILNQALCHEYFLSNECLWACVPKCTSIKQIPLFSSFSYLLIM